MFCSFTKKRLGSGAATCWSFGVDLLFFEDTSRPASCARITLRRRRRCCARGSILASLPARVARSQLARTRGCCPHTMSSLVRTALLLLLPSYSHAAPENLGDFLATLPSSTTRIDRGGFLSSSKPTVLTGTIPQDLGTRFPDLAHLDLAYQVKYEWATGQATYGISGRIPAAGLSKLTFLDLRGNDGEYNHRFNSGGVGVSGTLPETLTGLETLRLTDTGVSGTMPATMTRVRDLHLGEAGLVGGSTTSSKISGPVPSGFLAAVRVMHMSPLWSGRADIVLGAMVTGVATATQITLSAGLSGTLPPAFFADNWASLTDFMMPSVNKISGALAFPLQSTGAAALENVAFGGAELGGTIPGTISGFSKLVQLTIWGGSKISGRLPGTISRMVNLTHMMIFGTSDRASKLGGPVPEVDMPSLKVCVLGGNGVAGGYDTEAVKLNGTSCDPGSTRCTPPPPASPYRCCEDGGPGSRTQLAGSTEAAVCALGTDTTMCGIRYKCPVGSEGTPVLAGSLVKCGFDPTHVCRQCPLGRAKGRATTDLERATSCEPCAPGQYADEQGLTNCKTCPAGRFNAIRQAPAVEACLVCPAGRWAGAEGATSLGACSLCSAGYYNDRTGQSEYLAACTECNPGRYQAEPGQASCRACGPGRYSPASRATKSATCAPCGAGKYSSAQGANAESQCFACQTGAFSTETGATSAGSCISCAAGKASPSSGASAATVCGDCAKGRYQAEAGKASCEACPSGTYLDETGVSSASSCKPCAKGRYSSAQGATLASQCNTCSTGTYGDETGQTATGGCKSCDAGKFNGEAGQTANLVCSDCTQGQYQTEAGKASCEACPGGKYLDETGKSSAGSCKPCANGRYSSAQGATLASQCNSCGAGTFGDSAGQTTASSCKTCEARQWSAQGASVCSMCEPGKTSESGQSLCVPCAPGTAGPTCAQCAQGHFSSVGAAACTVCGSGRYATPARDRCEACPRGKYSAATQATDATTCKKCASGKYSAALAASSEQECNRCFPGTWSAATGATSAATCQLCPAGRALDVPGATSSALCRACIIGQYQDQSGQASCRPAPCSPGTFGVASQNATQAAACHPCPTGTYSPASGLVSVSQCSQRALQRPASQDVARRLQVLQSRPVRGPGGRDNPGLQWQLLRGHLLFARQPPLLRVLGRGVFKGRGGDLPPVWHARNFGEGGRVLRLQRAQLPPRDQRLGRLSLVPRGHELCRAGDDLAKCQARAGLLATRPGPRHHDAVPQ